MTDSLPESPSAARAEARRLFHDLRAENGARSRAAAARFARLRSFAELGPAGVLAERERVRLKHALAVVAEEHGRSSWNELLAALAARAPAVPSFHDARLEALLNRWFADHAEASAERARHGGYLLPYGTQFFVTESEGVRLLGLDPDDPDWRALDFDLARPRDTAAFARLCARRRAALEARP